MLLGFLLGFGVSQHYNAENITDNNSYVNCTFLKRSGLSDFYLVHNRILEVKEYKEELRFDPPGKKLYYGQQVRISGVIIKTPFSLTGTLYEGRDIGIKVEEAPLPVSSRLDRWKISLSEQLILHLGAEPGALASSLVLGTTHPALKERADTLRFLGIIHILSISGFHVNLLEMLLAKAGLKRISLLVILSYALLINSVPAWRAALMKLSKESARIFRRDSDGTNQLLTAMAVLLLGRPYLLFNASFQLTCAATLGLTALSRPLAEAFLKIPQNPLKNALLLSFAAMIPCLPFLSAMSFEINLALFAANILIVPLYSVVCILAFFSLPAAIWNIRGLFFMLSFLMDGMLRITTALEFILVRFFSVRVSYEGCMLFLWLAVLFVHMKQQGTSVRRQVLALLLSYGLMFQLTFLPGTTRVLFYKQRGQARVLVRHNLSQYDLVTESMYKSGVRRTAMPVEKPCVAGDLLLMPETGDFPAVIWQGRRLMPRSDLSSDIIEEEYLLILGKWIRLK